MPTVKELRDSLKQLPDDMLIVMSSDSEGNSHSPFSDISIGKYVAESTWGGSYYNIEDYESEVAEEWIDENDGVDALCLWPTN